MKTILCYGDSNTFGTKPILDLANIEKYEPHARWTGVLKRELGEGYEIIAEACNGRTTVWDDPIEGYTEGHKNGKKYLIPCLDSHQPLDLVIIMLGTNDLKARFSVTAGDIAQSAGALVDTVQRYHMVVNGGPQPKILLIAPPPLRQELPKFAVESFGGGYEKSLNFSSYYRQTAKLFGCAYLDAGQVIVSSPIDGIHFDLEEHQKLGQAVAEAVRDILA